MAGFDLSKFKKIAQDKKSATLKHPDGHQIKVAISALNGPMRKQLEALPLHQAEAEDMITPMDPESPASAQDAPPIEDAPPAQAPSTPDAQSIPQSTPEQSAESAPPPADAAAAQQAPAFEVPISGAQSIGAPSAPVLPLTAEQRAQARTAEDLKFSDDMRTGKITPATYRSLWEKKDTLGKIGTIFGLLLSGIGSGLSKQPNMALAMMDKEIERDLEAQKTSQENKQNWRKLSMEYEKQLPENALKWTENDLRSSDADMARWRNAQAGIADLSTSVRSMNNMRSSKVIEFQNFVDMMPPGPQKDQAQRLQDTAIVPFFLNRAGHDNLLYEKKKDAINAAIPKPKPKPTAPPKGDAEPGVKYDVVNQNKLNAMIQKGKFAPQAADAIPENLIGPINEEITHLTTNRNNYADAEDSFNKLAEMGRGAGQMPIGAPISVLGTGAAGVLGSAGGPMGATAAGIVGHGISAGAGKGLQSLFERDRAPQVEALKSRLGGNMSDTAKDALAESILPSWKDLGNQKRLEEVHRKLVQHFESNPAEAAPNLTRFGLKNPLPKYKFKPVSKKGSSKDNGDSDAGEDAFNALRNGDITNFGKR